MVASHMCLHRVSNVNRTTTLTRNRTTTLRLQDNTSSKWATPARPGQWHLCCSGRQKHYLEFSKVNKQTYNYTLDYIWQHHYQMFSSRLSLEFLFLYLYSPSWGLSSVSKDASRKFLHCRVYWSWVGFLKTVILAPKPTLGCVADISSGSPKPKKVSIGELFTSRGDSHLPLDKQVNFPCRNLKNL